LEKNARGEADPADPFSQKVGDFYGTCMDEQKAETASLQTLQSDLKRIDAIRDAKSLAEQVAYLQARQLGCDDETVRRVIRAFNARGVAALRQGSSRPRRIHAAFDRARGEQLRALLHQSPRTFGQPTSVWTLELAAAVSCEEGLTPTRVSGETIRATLQRLGIRWQRAKHWITSPDPAYARKKARATA